MRSKTGLGLNQKFQTWKKCNLDSAKRPLCQRLVNSFDAKAGDEFNEFSRQ